MRSGCIVRQSLTVSIAVAEVSRAVVASLTDLETVAIALVSLFSMLDGMERERDIHRS